MADKSNEETKSPAAAKKECRFIPEAKYVMAGWGCCRCNVYNGVWRENCHQCFHLRCVDIPQDVIDRQQAIRKELGYVND